MPSQEEIQICDTVDNFNNILTYENDLHFQQNHQADDIIKSLPLNGIQRSDNYKNSVQQQSNMVCVRINE